MPFCSILTCKNDSRNVNLTHGGITYHRFPQDPELRDTWTEATGKVNWKPRKGSSICSAHFDDKYFMLKEKHKKRLCSYAVPTLKVLSFHSEMQVVRFEKLEEPLDPEYQPQLPDIFNEQPLQPEYQPQPSDNFNEQPIQPEYDLELADIFNEESLPPEYELQLADIFNEQAMRDVNISVMVPVKTPNDDKDEDDDDDDDDEKNLTERERKLKAKLRWTRSEIKRQKRTIKNHEMQIYRLKTKRKETKKILDMIQDKFAMPIQEIVKIDLKNS